MAGVEVRRQRGHGNGGAPCRLTALGIGPGDEVIVPSYTFIATSFAVVQAGAIPRFADVNLDDHCISVKSAEQLINERTKAIMPVHLYGNVCDMDRSGRWPSGTTSW
jgi:dTDP-4-amino-4,6-dideoxygalactose transaminase